MWSIKSHVVNALLYNKSWTDVPNCILNEDSFSSKIINYSYLYENKL